MGTGRVHRGHELAGAGELAVEAEAVVIGSGAGGSACAAVLAESGLDVLVLEEGADHSRRDFSAEPFEMLRRLYRDHGMTTAIGLPDSPTFPIPMGRGVGGTTTIGSGTCFRVPDGVLDEWARDLGLENVAPEPLARLFERVERDLHVAAPPLETIGRNGQLLHRGAVELGVSSGVIRRNARGCRGSGVCAFGCPTDAKQSALVSYIPRALAAGASLYADVRAERILHAKERVHGVEASVLDPGTGAATRKVRVRAPVVVVACGTALTPLLLQKSKIGTSSGQLGRNLHVHPAARVMALFPDVVRSWEGIPQSYYVDEWRDDGLLIEGIAVPPVLGAMAMPGVGREHAALMERYDHFASWEVMVSDTSRGRVRAGLSDGPLMTYQLNPKDAWRLVQGIAHGADLAFAAGATVVYAPCAGLPPLRSRDDARRLLREGRVKPEDLDLLAFHPLGTARMGGDRGSSVVDSYLETHDVDGLFVTDGSVFPTSLQVNPQLTIMAFAVRTAEHIASTRAPDSDRTRTKTRG